MKNKKITDASTFFDSNIDFYGSHSGYDDYFLDFIKSEHERRTSLLDIGGGTGTFANLVLGRFPDIDVTVIDPSQRSLNMIDDPRIRKVNGMLPNKISLNSNFDYIHVKEVFHHITGSSIRSSKELLMESLVTIEKYLKNGGFLLIHELFYETYVFPSLSRTLIFYLLLLQNKFGIRIPAKEFFMDLKVCFYSRPEFRLILSNAGFKIVNYRYECWANTYKKRALMLHNWGRMLFILEKA
jgi:SAM-dependent methyltransferase